MVDAKVTGRAFDIDPIGKTSTSTLRVNLGFKSADG